MLSVKKNTFRNESQLEAYWRLRRDRDDRLTANLFIGYAIVLVTYCALAVMGIAHF